MRNPDTLQELVEEKVGEDENMKGFTLKLPRTVARWLVYLVCQFYIDDWFEQDLQWRVWQTQVGTTTASRRREGVDQLPGHPPAPIQAKNNVFSSFFIRNSSAVSASLACSRPGKEIHLAPFSLLRASELQTNYFVSEIFSS